MSDRMTRLVELKGMLDQGFIDRNEFAELKAELFAPRTPATLDDGLGGATRLGSATPNADPLLGATRVEPDPGSGSSRGLTIMGRSVAPTEVDLGTLPAGAMFDGRYTIVSRLGVGGMGTVYQAVDIAPAKCGELPLAHAGLQCGQEEGTPVRPMAVDGGQEGF